MDIQARLSLAAHARPYKTDKETRHGYLSGFYERVLEPYREKPVTLLEIGVWKGESLRMWRGWFPRATIIGVDRFEGCAKPVQGVRVDCAEAYHPDYYAGLPSLDIVIEDGDHVLGDYLACIGAYLPKIRRGGVMVLEDIPGDKVLAAVCEALQGVRHKVWDGRSASHFGDSLAVIAWKDA